MLPKQIILCRHVEKPKDPANHGASRKGEARAQYLAQFFLTPNTTFNKPDFIYAFTKKASGLDNRSYEAMEPLIKIGTYDSDKVNTTFGDSKSDSLSMISDVLKNHGGETVLICWEHNVLPMMIQSIGQHISSDDVFHEFQSWNANPSKTETDNELYSLTIVIDVPRKCLTAISQSDNYDSKQDKFIFDANSFSRILFKMP
jgi:hypothetical protein